MPGITHLRRHTNSERTPLQTRHNGYRRQALHLILSLRRHVMNFAFWMAWKSLTHVIPEHVARSGYAPINYMSLARHKQRFTGIKILSCRYYPPTCLKRCVVRGIATNNTTTSRKTFIPSIEQQAVVELCRTQNVVVSARPGAGKTATAKAIVAANLDIPIAIVTYSKRLQLDTARRLEEYPWSDVFTFHGLAGRLFATTAYNDSVLRSLRKKRLVPTWSAEPYEIIILDELQDCTDDLFWLICAFISAVTHAASGRAPRIVALGDERQAIYGFKGADARYLSLSSSAMATLSPYPWTHLDLSKSFRLSHENSTFVNNAYLGGDQYIVGSHNGPKPLYLHGDISNIWSISKHLIPLIRQYGPENTAILTPSVRKNVPLSLLTNYLSEVHSMPIAVSIADDIPLDDQVLRGKICVSTYHQFKGNERDLVIVYGVDAGYFQFLARDLPDDTCPNGIFVALTRACKHLVILQDSQKGPMPFVNVAELYTTADVVNLEGNEKRLQPRIPGRPLHLGLLLPKLVAPSDLPRHVSDEVIDNICAEHLEIQKILPYPLGASRINAPAIVLTDSIQKHYEAVSDLNGLAVMAAYEHALLGTFTTLKSNISRPRFPSNAKAQAIWLCREACKYEAETSGYRSRYIQMKGHPFDWLGNCLNAARVRLEAQFPDSGVLEFEVTLAEEDFCVAQPFGGKSQTTNILGRADIIQYGGALGISTAKSKRVKGKRKAAKINLDKVAIWEIKFVAQLSHMHAIQACIYAYLWSNKLKRGVPPRIILFNVRDGEKWEMTPRDGVASLRRLLEKTLVAKFSTTDILTTDEFLEKCARTRTEVEKSYQKTR